MLHVTVVGHVGRVELKEHGDTEILAFSIAWNNPRDKEADPTWFECSLWGKRGAAVGSFLEKGHQVCVLGELTFRQYTTKDGELRESKDIRVTDIQVLSSRDESSTRGEAAPARSRAGKRSGSSRWA